MRTLTLVTAGALTLTLIVICSSTKVDASGNYRKNRIPQRLGADKDTLELGKKIFAGKMLRGEKGRSCASCHGDDAEHEFRRSSLKKLDDKLYARTLECWKDPERFSGDPKLLRPGTKSAFALGVFLVSQKRLPKSSLDRFETPAKPEKDR